jgi:hypothetical protein
MAGCSGTVQDSAKGGAGSAGAALSAAPAGTGNDGPNNSDVGAGASAGAGACVGELDQVAAAWGDCPATLCAAQVLAESCDSLQIEEATEVGTCDMLRVITLEMGTTHGKDCYYDLASSNAEPKLVGAAAWDDTPTYCNGTSNRIEAGKTTPNCGAFTQGSTTVCDRPSGVPNGTGGNGAGGSGAGGSGGSEAPSHAPPAACFNALSHSCGPC